MIPDAWLLAGAVALLVLIVWTGWTLVRLRRLETRVERAWRALDTQLRRRAGLADELARTCSAALGKDRAVRLAGAAADARNPAAGDREAVENALGRALRDLPDDLPGVPPALIDDLAGTTVRVGLARRFYNDAVRDIRTLRRHRLPRLLRLHASRPLPRFFDIDERADGVLPGLDGAGARRP